MISEPDSPLRAAASWVVPVRDLVDFVLRRGGLSRGRFRSARRALEGTRGHQEVQAQRPPNYQAEVPVRDRILTPGGQLLVVQGRIDGVLAGSAGWLLEEIKTVTGDWNGEPRELDWSQARVYAALFTKIQDLEEIEVQLTYLHLDTSDLTVFRRSFSAHELQDFYRHLTEVYGAWIDLQTIRQRDRDLSILQSSFPFPQLREGQEALLSRTREALREEQTLLAEAPTGIGKTISVLHAAVNQLARSDGRLKLAYLTAKTTGHDAPRQAVADLGRSGIRLTALAFAARDRLCFGQADGSPCDVTTCPHAAAHYDHRHEALRDALEKDWVGLEELRELALKHRLCPAALALDLLPWVDLVVCDYNYAFHPSVRLGGLTNDGKLKIALLIDEAHNLPDRARAMFSAALSTEPLTKLKSSLGQSAPPLAQAVEKIVRILDDTREHRDEAQPEFTLNELPRGLRPALSAFLAAADRLLARNHAGSAEEDLLSAYFDLSNFLKLLELGDAETHVLVLSCRGRRGRRAFLLRWLCLDPEPLLEKACRETGPAVIFSATLSPAVYFERLLGGGASRRQLKLTSPFPPENLGVMVHPGIATTYRKRSGSYGQVAETLAAFALGKRGHYLAYFSSHDYLKQVENELRARRQKGLRILSQSSGMDLDEREAFLKHFRRAPSLRTRTSLLGLAVLGGLFAEGVDLVGSSLIGVAVVGVGLPQVNLENDLIKERFSHDDDHQGRRDESRGFDFAYTYPGFNRVLQAVGRIIRTETDRGMALLIDERYRQHRYRDLFPEWWQPQTVRSIHDIAECQEQFWSRE